MNRTQSLVIVGQAVLFCAITLLMLRNGVMSSPDGWAYWEGSVSLLEHARYEYFGGGVLKYWPPLFSIYLAIFQWIGRSTGEWLAIACSVIAFLNVIVWGTYAFHVARAVAHQNRMAVWGASAVFTSIFGTLFCVQLLAQPLMLVFIGSAYAMLVKVPSISDRRGLMRFSACFGLLLSGALLSHNSAIVYVAASATTILLSVSRPLTERFIAASIAGGIGTAPWLASRLYLGQLGSHSSFSPMFRPFEYAQQMFVGLGQFLFRTNPHYDYLNCIIGFLVVSGIAYLAVSSASRPFHKTIRPVMLFTLVSLVYLFLLFNTVWIHSELNGRFIWFIPLAATPVFLAWGCRHWALALSMLIVFVAMPARRMGTDVLLGTIPRRAEQTGTAEIHYIRSDYYLTSRSGATSPTGAVRVSPPTYPWIPRWKQQQESQPDVSLVLLEGRSRESKVNQGPETRNQEQGIQGTRDNGQRTN